MSTLLIILNVGLSILLLGLIYYSILFLIDIRKEIKKFHITNEKEIDIYDNLKKYFDQRVNKLEAKLEWGDFNPSEAKIQWDDYKPRKTNAKRGEDGKYNPDEIPGVLDNLFGEK